MSTMSEASNELSGLENADGGLELKEEDGLEKSDGLELKEDDGLEMSNPVTDNDGVDVLDLLLSRDVLGSYNTNEKLK